MVTTTSKLAFAEFLAKYPDGEGKFELVNGEIVPVEATRAHKNVSRYLVKSLDRESERLGLNYIVDKDIIIQTVNSAGEEQGRNPDVSAPGGEVKSQKLKVKSIKPPPNE